jgi:lysophospholipase L1-like esterase
MLGGHVRVTSIHHARFVAIRTVITLGIALGLASSTTWAANEAVLNKIVVVGDSLSAGFENFTLFDVTTVSYPFPVPFPFFAGFSNTSNGGQQFGYAAQVVRRATGTDLTLPLFTYPGVPFNFLFAAPPAFGRENPNVQTNNLSVPGFTVANAISTPFNPTNPANGIEAMSNLILGTPQYPDTTLGCGPIPFGTGYIVSELTCAIAMKPSLLLVSIGSNDALQALTLGTSPTDSRIFAVQYLTFLAGLASSGAKIAVSNIPDVTSLPYLVRVADFGNSCPAGSQLPNGWTPDGYVVANVGGLGPTTFLNLLDPCTNGVARTRQQVQAAGAAVNAYNKTITQVATALGAFVIDVNSLFSNLQKRGYVANGKTLTTKANGGLFSADRIHPSATGYAILANATIDVINSHLQTQIPKVDVDDVAANDPFAIMAH